MNGITAVKNALMSTKYLLEMYVSDLTDADLLVRPVPGANHIAWQIGNVIIGDSYLISPQLPEAKYPELPPGFMEKHSAAGAKDDGPDGFLSKAEYLDLFNRTRAATVAALESLSDDDLDRDTGPSMAQFAPTLGEAFLAVANHTMMHGGQFTVIRRQLDKPVLM